MLLVKLPGTFSDATLPLLTRDDVIVPGTLWAVDLATDYSYSGSDPANAAAVKDLTLNDRHSSVVLTNGTIERVGGGFDFSDATDAGSAFLKIPAGVLSDLQATQHFLGCLYLKFPSATDWSNATSNPSSFLKILAQFGGNNVFYSSQPVLFYISQYRSGANPLITIGRQTALNTVTNLQSTAGELANFFETVVQVGVWRNGSEFAFRLKNAAGTLTKSTATGSLNSVDMSGAYGSIGEMENSIRLTGTERTGLRFYRGFLEDLSVSGRTPTTVLDADWARVVERGDFS